MAPPGRALPSDAAELDRLLLVGDPALPARLRARSTGAEVATDLNWESSRLYDGAGFLAAYAYMNDLWRLGSASDGATGEGLKGSAAMAFLYAFDLVAVDGVKCADPSAPAHRTDQLIGQNPEIVRYIHGLPLAARVQIADISLAIELATADLRRDDAVLCSGGLAQIRQGLAAQGDKPLALVPNSRGTVGRTYAVPAAPGYRPQFAAPDVWRPRQEAARRALPNTLDRVLADAPATPTHAGGGT